MKKTAPTALLPLLLLLTFGSCVSNKKHQAAIATLNTNHQTAVDQLNARLKTANGEIGQLNLRLAERKGENNILVQNADKFEKQVEQLEQQIESLETRSSSNQKGLNQQLRQKDQTIEELRQQLGTIETELDRHAATFGQLLDEMRDSMRYWSTVSYASRPNAEEVAIILPESLLFRSGSVTRMEEDGYNALEKFAEVLERYPNMSVTIVCHTDNKRPKNRSYKDNWNFSLLQSASIVRTLIQDFDLNAGQLLPGGKGEFAPRASNENPEGREQNRRTELVIRPAGAPLSRAIRNKL